MLLRSLFASIALFLATPCAFAQSNPDLYVRKATFAETMLGTRARLREYSRETGFRPYVSGFTRKTGKPHPVTVNVEAVDRLFLVAHHEAERCFIPAVWGDAKLIAKDGTVTPLADLEPASMKALRRSFARHRKPALAIGEKRFEHGIYAVTPAQISYKLERKYERFEAVIGISHRADRNNGVRFKVLDRPNSEDVHTAVWRAISRDYPRQATEFRADEEVYWLGNDRTEAFEFRLIEIQARAMGGLGGGIRAEAGALSKAKLPHDDPSRIALLDKAIRFRDAGSVIHRVNVDAIERILQAAPTPDAEAKKQLDAAAVGMSAVHEAMKRCDESGLPSVRQAVDSVQQVLRKALVPALGAEAIVFAVRDPGRDGHWYANFGYWCSDPKKKIYCPGGSRLAKLDLRTGEVTDVLKDPGGAFRDPQVHYDGSKILFSFRKGGTENYHLYEVNADGTGLRQLTSGPFDDIEPTYLPDGDIVFCSSRCNRWVNCWHTQVAILYRCDPDGGNIRVLSSNVEHDNTPWPLPDGRLLYTRWEYVDRSQMAFHHLWTVNPDGTGQMVYFGNQLPSRVFIDAKPIPGTQKIVASFCPGHGRREHAGAITIVTPAAGPDEPASETCVNKEPVFRDPYPASEDLFLVARDNRLLVMNGDGVCQELYRAEKHIHEPRPLCARPREHVIPSRTSWTKTHGQLILQDVTVGRNMAGVKKGEVKKLLVLESLPKSVNHSGGMDIISDIGTFTLERVLGTVPVEPDGSANFLVPANRSVFFVALGENDLSLKRMQSFVSVLPGETTSCVGCHESRVEAPAPRGTGPVLSATQRPPSRIERFEGLPDVIDFPRHVQPILDKHCAGCHSYEKRAGKVILTNDYGARRGARRFTQGYWTLLFRRQFADGGNHYSNRPPRTIGTGASPLMHKIIGKHHGVALSEAEKRIVWMWIEVGAPYAGTYAALLTTTGPTVAGTARQVMGKRCNSCHNKDGMRLPTDPRGIRPHYYRDLRKGVERFATPLLFNISRPEKSMALLAPLAKEAGGYGICPGPVFADKNDPDYKRMLASMKAASDYLKSAVLYHMPGFKPNLHYIREMQRYGVLAKAFDIEKHPIDVFQTDQAYWRTFWHQPDLR